MSDSFENSPEYDDWINRAVVMKITNTTTINGNAERADH